MEKQQELEWSEAQKIRISVDLVAAAKQQLQFLAEVDRHWELYDGPALEHAIYRYKHCWLPLLAKHAQSPVLEGPLVVPLDCEWIWHCHRLNPVRYKSDCEELYGKILGNQNVISSIQATCKKKTEEIWKTLYAYEPYELKLNSQFQEAIIGSQKTTIYNLVDAVKRQSSFYYQVSRPHMNEDAFLEEALARYKGFLHLIKRNKERFIGSFCVPTYDIDLLWHAHQLHPVSYFNDLVAIMGSILEHDDTDSDRTRGKKLDVGFSETRKQWAKTFGSRYCRAGAMHRGTAPSPLATKFHDLETKSKKGISSFEYQGMIQLPKKMIAEVMLEIVEVRDIPDGIKGSLYVTLSKKQPDIILKGKRRMNIFSVAKEKQIAVFQCEPTGDLVCLLVACSATARLDKVLGMVTISLQELIKPGSPLSVEKWFELVPSAGAVVSKPIKLRIAISFVPPVGAPFMLTMVQARQFTHSCFFQHGKSWTYIVDSDGNIIINLQMRDATGTCFSKKEVIGMNATGKPRVLADFAGTGWSLMNSSWWFQPNKNPSDIGNLFELTGSRKVLIFPGRKLEYEIPEGENHQSESNFMTAVEFSAEYPYGKAVALFGLKSGFLQVNEEWLVLLAILLAFLLSNTSFASNNETNLNIDGHKITKQINKVVVPKIDCKFGRGSAGRANCGVIEGVQKVAEENIEVIQDSTCNGKHGSACIVSFGEADHAKEDGVKSSQCGGCGGGCGGGGSCGGGSCGGGGGGGGGGCQS